MTKHEREIMDLNQERLALISQNRELIATLKKCSLLLKYITTDDFSKGKDHPLRMRIEKILDKYKEE